jgi:hypothetical protein
MEAVSFSDRQAGYGPLKRRARPRTIPPKPPSPTMAGLFTPYVVA